MASKEQNDPKLEWMYKGATDLLNREEYLLGRTIDKNFEHLDKEEKDEQQEKLFGVQIPKNHVEYECIPFSIREFKNLQNNEQVDLQRKLMEDPLMSIKQKEMETRRKILENPVKLKEIHKILKTEKNNLLLSNVGTKKKKSKKSKKSKKYSSTSCKESDSDLDDEKDLDKLLAKKYKKVKHSLDDAIKRDIKLDTLLKNLNKRKRKNKDSNSSSNESSSTESDSSEEETSKSRKGKEKNESRKYDSNAYKYRRDVEKKRNEISSRSNSSDYNRNSNFKRNRNVHRRTPIEGGKYKEYTNPLYKSANRRNYDRPHKFNVKESTSFSYDKTKRIKEKFYKNQDEYSKNLNYKFKEESKSSSRNDDLRKSQIEPKYPNERNKSVTGKLTEKEKQQRIKEMMEDAAKRDEERSNKVNKYRKDCEDEEHAQKNRRFDENFAKKELQKVLSSNNTVESRIKSKINNIQRSSTAMDSNFAKK